MASMEWYDYQCDPADLDDRMLRFDELPPPHTPLAADHPLQQSTVPSLASRGLRDYHRSKSSEAARGFQSLHVGRDTTTTCAHLRRQPKPRTTSTGTTTTTTTTPARRPDALACPFSKLDPQRHRACLAVHFTSVRSVKQHIIIDHHAPISCPICHAAFASAADRDQHIVARTCTRCEQARDLLAGVNEDQVEKLMLRDDIGRAPRGGRKGERSNGELQRLRWFKVWDTVFPGEPRPASAHMSLPREKEIVELRRYWRKKGRKMVHAALKEEERADQEVLEGVEESVLRNMMNLAGL